MILLAFLIYWRRALRGWRTGWKADGLVWGRPYWVTRPLEAPEWSVESVQRFEKAMRERLEGRVPKIVTPLAMTDANRHAEYFRRNLSVIRAQERVAIRAEERLWEAQPRWKRLWWKLRHGSR